MGELSGDAIARLSVAMRRSIPPDDVPTGQAWRVWADRLTQDRDFAATLDEARAEAWGQGYSAGLHDEECGYTRDLRAANPYLSAGTGAPLSDPERCGVGTGGGEVCWLPTGHAGPHDPDAPDAP